MAEYTKNTGTSGVMMIVDNGTNAELWIKAAPVVQVPQMPWKYILNGRDSGWQSHNLVYGGEWQKLVTLFEIQTTQPLTFTVGNTGTTELGGPTDFTIQLFGPANGSLYVKVGASYRRAVPYVNDDGEWKLAQPLTKHAGTWKRTN